MKRYIKAAIGNLQEEDELARFELAKSPNTDIETLEMLAQDTSRLVRFGVYNNPNITPAIRTEVSRCRFSIYHAEYKIYCIGDINDKDKISTLVEDAIDEMAICTSTPYVCIPPLKLRSDYLSINGSFDVPGNGADEDISFEEDTLDNIKDILNTNGYRVITSELI